MQVFSLIQEKKISLFIYVFGQLYNQFILNLGFINKQKKKTASIGSIFTVNLLFFPLFPIAFNMLRPLEEQLWKECLIISLQL